MCHGFSERLKRLLKNAWLNDSEVIKLVECAENCEFCRKYKKVVSFRTLFAWFRK